MRTAFAAQDLSPGVQLYPLAIYAPGLYNAQKNRGESARTYRYAVYDLQSLAESGISDLFVTGESATNEKAYPLGIFLDSRGRVLETFGVRSAMAFSRLHVTAPENAATLIVHGRMAERITVYQAMDARIKSDLDPAFSGYDLAKAAALVAKRAQHPIRFAQLDQGYVTFCFDDLRSSQDSICSLFEQFGYPVCLAAIPENFSCVATGLQQNRGSYYIGMTMLEVARKAVDLGGEVLVHNTRPITEQTNTEYGFMYDSFVRSKQSIENAGFHPRGYIGAGGTGRITRTQEIEQWLIGNYDYATNGTSEVYSLKRHDINSEWDRLREMIDQAVEEKTWLRIVGHSYDEGGGKTFRNEQDLVDLLQYCKDRGIQVVTFAYMYDHFAVVD